MDQDLTRSFNEFESTYSLFDLTHGGVPIWVLMRRFFFRSLQASLSGHSSRLVPRFSSVLNPGTNPRYYSAARVPIGLEPATVLVFNNFGRRYRRIRRFDCIYTGRIVRALNESYVVLERPLLGRHVTPPEGNVRYLDLFELVLTPWMYYQAHRRRSYESVEVGTYLQAIAERHFGISESLGLVPIVDALRAIYYHTRSMISRVIERVRPSIVIEVSHSTILCFIATEIAKSAGSVVVELQHGPTDEIAYQYDRAFDARHLPDSLLVFGRYWRDRARLPADETEVKVVGFPHLEARYAELADSPKDVVLFVSGALVGTSLARLAARVAVICSGEGYRVVYKLHDSEKARWRRRYGFLNSIGVHVARDDDKDIHYWLARAAGVVGVASTALFEAARYRTRIMLVGGGGGSTSYLLEAGYAESIDCAADILACLRRPTMERDPSYLWEPQSLSKMRSALREQIGRVGAE